MGTVDEVTVVGAGAMGYGLAVQFVRSGIDVTVVDHREANLDRDRERIRNAARFLVDRELADPDLEADVATVDYTLDCARAVAETDLVLETITEDLGAKRELFAELATEADEDAILAFNTSGLPITDIAAETPDVADRIRHTCCARSR